MSTGARAPVGPRVEPPLDSTHTHIDAYAMKDTGRSVYILFNLWVLGKVASLVKSKGSSPSEVTSH